MTTVAPPPPAPGAGRFGSSSASPPPGPSLSSAPPSGGGRPPRRSRAAGRTLIAFVATAVALLPLKTLFSDSGWLVDAWLAMVVVLAPAALLRLRRPAGALDIWPGIVLLVPYLTARYVPVHATLGFIPTGATWRDVSHLMAALHHTTTSEVAPVHTTVAIRLVLGALVGLLAALIDLIAVVGRRGALAGVPLLVIFTVAGAVPRTPVPWGWFVFSAVGFLLLLGLGASDDIRSWGRVIGAGGQAAPGRPTTVASGRVAAAARIGVLAAVRIGVVAVVAAVALPLLAPGQSHNVVADLFRSHSGGAGGVGGTGDISPFAEMSGQLHETTPVELFTVHVPGANTGSSAPAPFYLRTNVLSVYKDSGWVEGDHGGAEAARTSVFGTAPPTDDGRTARLRAQITVTGSRGVAPLFADPSRLSGLPAGTEWSPQDQILLGSKVRHGERIVEDFEQPNPTVAELNRAPRGIDPTLFPWATVPTQLPPSVRQLVARLTRGTRTAYQRANAIERFFVTPKSHFVYDLQTAPSDSKSALASFLKHRRGFCQQYAAAMAIMLRAAHIPSRVVLGYMHPAPSAAGNFTVLSTDAHAWVEAYFNGIGWVPFDPTPASGLTDGGTEDPIWALHNRPAPGTGPNGNQLPHQLKPNSPKNAGASASPPTPRPGTAAKAAAGRQQGAGAGLSAGAVLAIVLVLLVLALALLPAMVRLTRRRRRYVSARRDGDTEALWRELAETAVDLGYVWSPARSPRQVAVWLARDASGSASALHDLALAVEAQQYAPTRVSVDGPALTGDLRTITAELRRRRSRRTRLRAALLPASLRRRKRERD